ncbi:MAG: hypothetical protein IH853_12175 [Bacteroidetes bacterium]|nr:hypothetical protein [Bacteroidota bacterium]MCH8247642.1 hypothetical protein [Bacteroidota bacterium]
MLEKELQYYIDHQEDLVEKYNGRVIILKNEEVLGVFKSVSEAYFHADTEGLLGEVMIHKVGPGQHNYTITITSNSVFA